MGLKDHGDNLEVAHTSMKIATKAFKADNIPQSMVSNLIKFASFYLLFDIAESLRVLAELGRQELE